LLASRILPSSFLKVVLFISDDNLQTHFFAIRIESGC
jgi:hypothetical protein